MLDYNCFNKEMKCQKQNACKNIHVKLKLIIPNNRFNQHDDFLGLGHCTKECVIMSRAHAFERNFNYHIDNYMYFYFLFSPKQNLLLVPSFQPEPAT